MARRPRAGLWEQLGVCVLLFGLGWLVTFGLSTQLGEASFGGPVEWDAGSYIAYFWHLHRSLWQGADPWFTDLVFHPDGLPLILQDWSPVPGLLALPFAGLGPLAAYNLQLPLAYLLTGWATYLLTRRLGAAPSAALLAALVFAFCEFRLLKAHYHGQPGHAHQQWIPLYLLCLWSGLDSGRIRPAVVAGLLFVLAAFTTPYQMVFIVILSIFTIVWMVIAVAVQQAPGARRGAAWQMMGRGAWFGLWAGGTALVLVAPLLWRQWDTLLAGAGSLGRSDLLHNADLLSFVRPSLWAGADRTALYNESWAAFVGYSPLALTAVALWTVRRNRAGLWLAGGAMFLVLSLGSPLMINGVEIGPLPFLPWMQQIPLVRGVRLAARYSSLVVLCWSVAMALALTVALRHPWLSRGRLRRPLLVVGLLLVVSAELLLPRLWRIWPDHASVVVPWPLALQLVEQSPNRGALLVYPLVWETRSATVGPHIFPRQLLTFQVRHRRPMVGGLGDAVPPATLKAQTELPLLRELIDIAAGKPPPPPTPRRLEQIWATASRLGIRHLLLYRDPALLCPIPTHRPYHSVTAARFIADVLKVERRHADHDMVLFEVMGPKKPISYNGLQFEPRRVPRTMLPR